VGTQGGSEDHTAILCSRSGTIIPEAAARLERGDLDGFGRWAARSQDLGDRLLRNQVPETVFLAREALQMGAAGAAFFITGPSAPAFGLGP